jgi:hypothetical protein
MSGAGRASGGLRAALAAAVDGLRQAARLLELEQRSAREAALRRLGAGGAWGAGLPSPCLGWMRVQGSRGGAARQRSCE